MQLTYALKLYECTCCKAQKIESDFYRESYTGRRTNQCKECINIKKRVQRGKSKHGKFVSKEKIRGFETPDYSLEDWRAAMLHFRGACSFCGKPEGRAKKDKLDRDHLVAISRGGKTIRNNVVPACTKCNRGRGNKNWEEWFPYQEFYTKERAIKIITWQKGQ